MKNKKQLHQLIHKLSKSDKRAFKLYIKKYKSEKEQKSGKLFDLIVKMPEYDEAKLLKISSKNQLTYDLHRLKNNLMNALSNAHFKNQAESPGEIINRIELGFKYEDPTIIEDNIKKGLELAEQEDNFALRLHMLNYQLSLNIMQKDYEGVIETPKEIINQTNRWNQTAHYDLMWGEMNYWKEQNSKKAEVTPIKFSNEKLTHLFNNPLNEQANFREKERYLKAKKFNLEITNDYESNYESGLENLEQTYDLYLTYDKPIPLATLYNLILNYFRLDKLNEAEEKLNQSGLLNNYQDRDYTENQESFIHLLLLILYFFYKQDNESIFAMEPKIESLIEDETQLAITKIYQYENLIAPLVLSCLGSKTNPMKSVCIGF